jgi:phospholipase/lecithinase/hemolysin
MTQAFNASLRAELAGVSGVLFVDVYTENQRQVANPSQFGLSNVTTAACATGPSNPTGSSLFCNASNLIAGNTSRYLFADGVHPTPYGHKLLSQLIIKQLVLAGWL